MAGEYWLESANCDIEPAQLTLIRGGDGDIYVTIKNKLGRHSVRVCYSGGPDREQGIRLATAALLREFDKMAKETDK